MGRTSRVRNRMVAALVAMALALAAVAAGGAGSSVAASEPGDAARDAAPAADRVPVPAPPEIEKVLDRTRRGADAVERLEAGGHLEKVAENAGWSPGELRAQLLGDDSLSVKPDGQLWYTDLAPAAAAEPAPESPAAAAAMAASLAGYSDAETFQLHSLPESTKTVYLDFHGMAETTGRFPSDGDTLYGLDFDGNLPCPPGTVDPACFSSSELAMIREIWMRVSEYFVAFDVDVTTEYPGLEAMQNLSCRLSSGYWFCPDGSITLNTSGTTPPQSPDQEYGVRVSFVSDSTDILPTEGPCLQAGAIGCAYFGVFGVNDYRSNVAYQDPAAKVLGVPNIWAPTKQPYPSTPRLLAEVAAHEIGHVLGLGHEVNEQGTLACLPDIDGSVWRALMGRCQAGNDGAPRAHFTPNICPIFEELLTEVNPCELYLKEEYLTQDSYARMARRGVVARADEPSPVVAPGPSFVASGVISPPLLTKRTIVTQGGGNYTTWHSPSPAPQDFSYTKGPMTGPGKLEYGGGLNLTQVDGSGTDIGSILDTADDAYPLRTFITLFDSNSQWEDWAVHAVTSSPGVKHLSAQRVGASSEVSNGFPAGTPLTVRYHGTGASGPMDTDSYEFTVPPGAGPTSISVTPAATSNLDVKATLYDATMTEVAVSDPLATKIDLNTVTGLDASIDATLAPGDYTLVVDGVGVPGSYIDYGSIGSYTVAIETPTPQTVEFTSSAPIDATEGAATYTPTATASSGLDPVITVDETSAGVCSIDLGVVSFDGAGTCTLNADQPGGSGYLPAAQVQQSFTVQAAGGAVVSLGDASGLERDSVTGSVFVPVFLSEPAAAPVTVSFHTVDGTAVAGADYTRWGTPTNPRSVTIPAGSLQSTINVPVRPDDEAETDESFSVVISSVSGGDATVGDDTGTATIVDADAASVDNPAITVSNPTIIEGDSGQRRAQFLIHLSRAPVSSVTVNYTTADGTAVAGQDYIAKLPGTVVFAPGQISKTVDVLVNSDTTADGPRQFTLAVTVTGGSPVEELTMTGTATIIDDDGIATPCPQGTFSATGTTPCSPAPPGFFVDSVAALSATPCPVGKYQPNSASISCLLAPIGSYVDTLASTTATPCPTSTTLAPGATSAEECIPDP